ncbi:MAG TPA: ABC transporter permease, partial [Balneolaceae bacterium]|nr:ABC transporter permease [Balneolaceae bacterium]
MEGNITAGAFRVTGIFDTPNSAFDESTVFVNREDLNRLLGRKNTVHEIAIMVDNFKNADQYRDSLAHATNLEIRSWGDVSP